MHHGRYCVLGLHFLQSCKSTKSPQGSEKIWLPHTFRDSQESAAADPRQWQAPQPVNVCDMCLCSHYSVQRIGVQCKKQKVFCWGVCHRCGHDLRALCSFLFLTVILALLIRKMSSISFIWDSRP